MREFLKGLELEKETIDAIMAEYGKNVQDLKKQVDEYKTSVEEYKKKENEYKANIDSLNQKANDNQAVQDELDKLKKEIADREAMEKSKKEDEILTKNITEAFGDKKFINDYTKNAIINDIKSALKDENNSGKSAKELFEEITKDKMDIFENPNKVPDMPDIKDVDVDNKGAKPGEIKLNPMFKTF
jgi:predicted RNase H-like nuclease (RuvC/YqgF family)